MTTPQVSSQSSWERSETQFSGTSFLSGVGRLFLERHRWLPNSAFWHSIIIFDLCRFGHRTSLIRFEPSLQETLVDSNHRCRASIRTLNGPFWARCKLGFDHKPRFITSVTNLGFVGCCYLFRGLMDLTRDVTQSPEQGGGCRRLPNFPDNFRFLRHQLISASLLLAFYRNLSASSAVGFEGVLPAGAHPGR